MIAPWAGVLVSVAAGIVLLAGISAWKARFSPHPEVARKWLHIGIGAIALGFPWLFRAPWPVFVVIGAALFILAALRFGPAHRLGAVLDDVDRLSRGDVWFLVAVALLFTLSGGDRILYGVPVLVLALADTAAALVGVRFGRLRYAVAGGGKTIEGSAAFLVTAFLCAYIPILLSGHAPMSVAMVTAAALAGITTVTEAFSRNGLDNLLVPLAAFATLSVLL